MEKVRKLVREILMEELNILGQETADIEDDLRTRESQLEKDVENLKNQTEYVDDLEKGQNDIIKSKTYMVSHPSAAGPDKKVQTKFRAYTLTQKEEELEKQKKYKEFAERFSNELERKEDEIKNLQITGAKDKMSKGTEETGDVVGTPDVPTQG